MTTRSMLYYFVVKGKGAFPTDMLRYDKCYPSTEISALNIARVSGKDEREVRLTSFHKPTPNRWTSFDWNVTEIDEVDLT